MTTFITQQIPNAQIKDAADQFEAARKLLVVQPPGSGVLLPLMTVASMAIELYLKCLSADSVRTYLAGADDALTIVTANPKVKSHRLKSSFDKIPADIQQQLYGAFGDRGFSLAHVLNECDGALVASRYPFEPEHNLSKFRLDLLLSASALLSDFARDLTLLEYEAEVGD